MTPRGSQLLALLACVAMSACSGDSMAPERPKSVPNAAVWAGGSKGGAWIACAADPTQKTNVCTVYYETSGAVWKTGEFVLRGEGRAATASELYYVDFDGRLI